jgi:transcriptional regulatory protein LevR
MLGHVRWMQVRGSLSMHFVWRVKNRYRKMVCTCRTGNGRSEALAA